MAPPTRILLTGLLAGALAAGLGGTAVWALASGEAEPIEQVVQAHERDDGEGTHDHADSSAHDDTGHDDATNDDATHDEHGLVLHDSTGGRAPTVEDEQNAEAFYDAVTAGISEYADLDVALADGYVESPNSANQSVKHYMKAGVRGDELDPETPSGLMYFVDENQATLLGAVWVTQQPDPPQPGGPLTVWHDHSSMGCPAAHPDCPAATGGEGAGNPPKMFHVWTWDGAVDPFAHDFMQTLGGSGPRGANGQKPTLPFDV
jgi:hypothetical protein